MLFLPRKNFISQIALLIGVCLVVASTSVVASGSASSTTQAVSAPPVAQPSPQTKSAVEKSIRAMFAAAERCDVAAVRALWTKKSADGEQFAGWVRDWKTEEKWRRYKTLELSRWEKLNDQGTPQVRVRVFFRRESQPVNEKGLWELERIWTLLCVRENGVWKLHSYDMRVRDFYEALGKVVTPLERETFLAREWSDAPPKIEAVSPVEKIAVQNTVRRMLAAYGNGDLARTLKFWHPASPARKNFAYFAADDLKATPRSEFSDLHFSWWRRRTQNGESVIKVTALVNWHWMGKGRQKGGPFEWRLTLKPSNAKSAPLLWNDYFFNNEDVGPMQDASAARRGHLWEDDWEIARSRFPASPAAAVQQQARERIRQTLDAFEARDVAAVRACWQPGEKADNFAEFVENDLKEGDNTRFTDLRFDHWRQEQDADGPWMRVRVQNTWSWRDIAKDKPGSMSSYWILTLRPDKRGVWKLSDRWSRDVHLVDALSDTKSARGWATILNEENDFVRVAPVPPVERAAAQEVLQPFIAALRSGDVAAAKAFWSQKSAYSDQFADIAGDWGKERRNNVIISHITRWRRLEDTENLAPPRIEARLNIKWSWDDVATGKANVENRVWDIWFEPETITPENPQTQGTTWRISNWRRRNANLKTALRDSNRWFAVWLLDSERETLTEEYFRNLHNRTLDVAAEKREDGRDLAEIYLAASYLKDNPTRQADALMVRAYVVSFHFFDDEAGQEDAQEDSREAARLMLRIGNLPGATKSLLLLGTRAAEFKDFETAYNLHDGARAFAQKTEDASSQIEALLAQGDDLLSLQRITEAKKKFAEALKLARSEKDLSRELDARTSLAAIDFNAGKM
ncbi:MAG TPA: hypothetical protein VF719_10170, partial [Abditibacteriaceae bacterium]